MTNQEVIEQVRALLTQLTPEEQKQLGYQAKRSNIYMTNRNQLRINAETGIGRTKGVTIGHYHANDTFGYPDGFYAWLTGAGINLELNKTKDEITVSMKSKVTPDVLPIIEKYMSEKPYVIPKQKDASQPPAPKEETKQPTPTTTTTTTTTQVPDNVLVMQLKNKLNISKEDAESLVKDDKDEAIKMLGD